MAFSMGGESSCAVDKSGRLFTWGSNISGQLGGTEFPNKPFPSAVDLQIDTASRVRQVSMGYSHAGVVTESGHLFVCGFGRNGQLGLGNEQDRTYFEKVTLTLAGTDKVLMVSCGYDHSIFLTLQGSVFTFGGGNEGQLGYDNYCQTTPRKIEQGSFAERAVVMVSAGKWFSAAIDETQAIYTWGDSEFGQLGHGDQNRVKTPKKIESTHFGESGIVFISAGDYHMAALTREGDLFTWGLNRFGQLGHGDANDKLFPVLVRPSSSFPARKLTTTACGSLHTLVVSASGQLWSCGSGDKGKLGLGDNRDRFVFELVQCSNVVVASAGFGHSGALTVDGMLWTWGSGRHGELGTGRTRQQKQTPTAVGQDIGLYFSMPDDHKLAFLMSTHHRLGHQSGINDLPLEQEIVREILNLCSLSPPDLKAYHTGLCRLLGRRNDCFM